MQGTNVGGLPVRGEFHNGKRKKPRNQKRFEEAAERLFGPNGFFPWELETLKEIILDAEARGGRWAKGPTNSTARPLGHLE